MVGFVVPLALMARSAFGQSPAAAPSIRELDYRPVISVPTTAAAAALGTATVIWRPEIAPRGCVWCEGDAATSVRVNSLDRWAREALVLERRDDMATFGRWFGYGVVPAGGVAMSVVAYAHGVPAKDAAVDFLVTGESVAIAHAIEQTIKVGTGRARPSVTFTPGRALDDTDPSDKYMSFPSGHATVGFAIAVSTGTVAHLRGYAWEPGVWMTGLSLATVSSASRILADRHYLTDVLAGAALGSAVGAAVPLLLHRPGARPLLPAGVTLIPVSDGSSGVIVLSVNPP